MSNSRESIKTLGKDEVPYLHSGISRPTVVALGFFSFFLLFGIFHYWMGGLSASHIGLFCLVLLFYLFHSQSRTLVLIGLPFLFQGFIYDAFRYIPWDWYKPIRIGEIYRLEQMLFGISQGDRIITLCEYLVAYQSAFLDLMMGVVYLSMTPVSILMVVLCWKLRSREVAERYAVAYLMMYVLAFITYLALPSAAPWYVEKFGFLQPTGPVMGDPAGLVRFDHLVGFNLSHNYLHMCPIVFGAVPSMHAGITTLAWLYASKINRSSSFLFGIFNILMCFSAVYFYHHYLIDIILGIAYAAIAFCLAEKILPKKISSLFRFIFGQLDDRGPKPFFGAGGENRGTKRNLA